MKTPDVVLQGKDNGDGMVVRYQTSKGTDIFGLGIPNTHVSKDWDLGPTWCYLVLGQKRTLIDTGRFGKLDIFQALMRSAGQEIGDIDRIIATHGHEDHDGNLVDILQATHAELWAHSIYSRMISYHPQILDGARHAELPGSCRLCSMPEKLYSDCLPYHRKRSLLKVDRAIDENHIGSGDDLTFLFTPGHSPDSICIILEDEIVFTGDTVLPHITPHPSLVHAFEVNRRILPEAYREKNVVYGLKTYVESLHRIASRTSKMPYGTLPGHRLFYNGQFNLLHSCAERAREIIQFHSNRCRDILSIIEKRPATVEEIAVQHFTPSQLRGSGKFMAPDEIRAHLEILEECGDIRWIGEKRDTVQATGSKMFLSVIGAYLR